ARELGALHDHIVAAAPLALDVVRGGSLDLDAAVEEREPKIPAAALAPHREAIEERTVVGDAAAAERAEPLRERVRSRDSGARRRPETLGTEQREIDRGVDRRERLVRADVARRLLAPDVLLARLQRVHESARAVGVHGLPRDASGHLPHERLAAREDPEMRTAVRHGDAQ